MNDFFLGCNSKWLRNQVLLVSVLLSHAISYAQMKAVSDPEAGSTYIDELLEQMTLDEKIGQLNLVTAGGTNTGIAVSNNVNLKLQKGQIGGLFGIRGAKRVLEAQKRAIENHRLNIPLIIGSDVIHGHETIFPIPLALSCTWDMALIEESARLAALEATADGIMWNFSPMVDIARDPRWGRMAEGAGEDPFLGSAIAVAMVKGYQQGDISLPESMMACVKHFALYGASEGGRDYNSVDMSSIRMHNEYLPPYKAAVDAGVGSIMTSFNVIDYLPASANKKLFTNLLRDDWGFQGFVVTDYTAINEMEAHGIGDLQEVSKRSIQAGIDMDMVGEGFLNTLKTSHAEGLIDEEDIDRACRRILVAKQKLGLFEDPYRYCDTINSKAVMMSPTHKDFAIKAAAESIVLLKNKNKLLPLNPNAKIALIGPLVDSRQNMLGTWSVSGDYRKAVTVLEAFEETIKTKGRLYHSTGCNISDDSLLVHRANAFGKEIVVHKQNPDAMIEEALMAADSAEVIVAVLGESANMSGESSSMSNIELQQSQKRLLKALKKTGKPIVLILFSGRPMAIKWESENIDAIMSVWFGGTYGALGISDVVFGKRNPCGHLTTCFPENTGQIPVYHSMLNTGRPYEGQERAKFMSNYLDISNDPVYSFGHGLSYTQFEYSSISMSDTILDDENPIYVSVDVSNVGDRMGKDVVQMYIRDVVGSISRPMRELKGFRKIELEAGKSERVTFKIDADLLKFYNYQLEYTNEPGQYEVYIGESSVTQNRASFTLK